MNVNIAKYIQEQTMSRPIAIFNWRWDWRDFLFKSSIISAGLMLMFLLVLFKSKTAIDFSLEPHLFFYAIFVTGFILSRIIAAMLYKSSFSSLVDSIKKNNDDLGIKYEPTVSFVIPCKNEEQDIADTINKCYEIDYPSDKFEVIVINDGSTDKTLDVLKKYKKKYPNLRVFNWDVNQGKRWGMTIGFMASRSEIVVQLDSDSYIDPETFQELIDPFQNPDISAVCADGQPKNANTNVLTKMQAAYYFMSFNILKAAESTYETVFCCSGCCSAYRKKAVTPILHKWVEERFLGLPVTWGDDRSLTSWIIKGGGKTIFANKARAYTIVPEQVKKLLVQQLRWKKSWIVNFFLTVKFIVIKQPFVSFFYYLPLFVISILTPIMTFRALIYLPLFRGILPVFHITGIILLTGIIALYYRYLDKENKYWAYLFLWSFFNLFILSFMMVWAAIRIQDRGWGTR